MEPAQASVEPASTGADADAAPGYIPIDIGDAIPAEHKYERITIRVEGVRRGALLSRGRDNGDETWSLSPDDLADLAYIPSKRGVELHSIVFRIVGVKGGFGEAIGSVDVKIDPAAIVQGSRDMPAAGNATDGLSGMAARFQSEVDAEVARRIASEKAKWDKTVEKRLADQAKKQTEAVANEGDGARIAELEMLVSSAEERIQAAEEAAQEANEALGQAITRAEAAEADAARYGMNEEAETLRAQLMSVRRELASVRASMRVRSGNLEEIQKEVHDALQDEIADQLEELHERYGLELERLTKLANLGGGMAAPELPADSVDVDAAVAAARRDWERDMEAKLAGVESATKKAIMQSREAAVSEARQQWEQELQEKLAAAQTEAERRFEEARADWRLAEQERLAAAQAEWQAAQPQPEEIIDEEEVARRIEAAEQQWQAAQNTFIEARDQEWQAEIERRIAEERAAWQAAEQERAAASSTADPEALAAAQEEWAQAQTLEFERRLLQAEEDWQAKDEERLQAAKAEWEADQQILIAERDERWKLELVRQLEEAKRAWKTGVEDHTPEVEMPAMVAAEAAPVGVAIEPEATDSIDPAVAPPLEVESTPDAPSIPDLPSFFEERAAEAAVETARNSSQSNKPDTEATVAKARTATYDSLPGEVPEWVEVWADRFRIPAHWVPALHRFGHRAGRFSRTVIARLRAYIEAKKAAAAAAKAARATAPAAPGVPGMAAASSTPAVNFRQSSLYRNIAALGRAVAKLLRVLFRIARVVMAKSLRVAVTAAVLLGLYHGYYFAKPHVYPHVEPYIAKYWDPHVGPYVRVYWDPYVQPYIDTYWGGYAKPIIVNAWDDYVAPPIEAVWDFTRSLAGGAWDGVKGVMPELPPPPNVGASVSQGAAKASGAVRTTPSPVAPRVYLRPEAANLRSGPSKYAALVGTVRQDDHIQRLEQNGGWIRIRVIAEKMKVGWVHGSLLSDAPGR